MSHQLKAHSWASVGAAVLMLLIGGCADATVKADVGEEAPPSNPVSKTTTPGECAHFVPFPAGQNGVATRASTVFWQQQDYFLSEKALAVSEVGDPLFTVRCSVDQTLAEHRFGSGDISQPLADRSATHLLRGDEIRAVVGVSTTCAVAAKVTEPRHPKGAWMVFRAQDGNGVVPKGCEPY